MNSPVRRARKTVAALAAACLMLVVSGCGGDEGGTTEGIDLVSKGKLTICTHLPYKPFEFPDDSGEVVGFDAELLGLLAKDLDLDVEVVDIGWNQIMSGAVFETDKCDIGMGAMTINPEREDALLISDPYFEATQALLVQTDSGYQGLEDLDGKKLGVQTDTTGQEYGDEHADEFGYETIVFDDSITEFNAVKSGQVDAAINDNGALYDFVQSEPDTEVSTEFDTGEVYGFPAMKDDDNAQKLIDRLNKVLAKAKKDGTYDEIYKKWFGTGPGEKAPSDG